MNIKKAYKKLAKLANGEFFSLRYEVEKHSHSKNFTIKYDVYVNNYGFCTGLTWGEALRKMDLRINPIPYKKQTFNNSVEDLK